MEVVYVKAIAVVMLLATPNLAPNIPSTFACYSVTNSVMLLSATSQFTAPTTLALYIAGRRKEKLTILSCFERKLLTVLGAGTVQTTSVSMVNV